MLYAELLFTLGLGFLFSLLITPVVRRLAVRLGLIDRPDNHRKLHQRVVARAGGTAILLSTLLVLAVALHIHFDWERLRVSQLMPYLSLLAAMVIIWLIGLADDIWNLRGRQKLLGQILVAAILVVGGFAINNVTVFGRQFQLGWLSIPISMIWLLACTNALNLIDGADGLCSTIGAIVYAALGVLAATNGHFAEAAIAFAFCGSLLGFLVYNFPPASIFLGDSGSLLVGMVSGALAVRCSLKGPASITMVVPLCILFLPLLDSTMAIVRRKLTGRSIYTTDRAHLHHMLRGKGLGEKKLLLVVAVIGVFNASVAILGLHFGLDWIGVVGVLFVFAILVKTKAFGYSEMVLLAKRSAHFASSFIELVPADKAIARHRAIQLQGSREWDLVWQTMVDFAEREKLALLQMDLHVPWLEEGFHGSWHRSKLPDRQERWSVTLPIFAGERIAGSVHLCGLAEREIMLGSLNRLTNLLEDVSPQIEHVIAPMVETDSAELSDLTAEPESAVQTNSALQTDSVVVSESPTARLTKQSTSAEVVAVGN
jgi:UDP-GlcNAc:undecaprenyl-phosphate/decaprenyl-phosphate GlcNAc-1-phosphate transferase